MKIAKRSSIFPRNIVFGTRDIGNVLDNSLYLIEHIKTADVICVESLTPFRELLKELDITTNAKIFSYEYAVHLEKEINKKILNEYLPQNKNILLLSDQGSAFMVDPFVTLKEQLVLQRKDYYVMAGPSAVINTYLSSGITDAKFYFAGMLRSDSIDLNWIFKLKLYEIPVVFFVIPEEISSIVLSMSTILEDSHMISISTNLTFDDAHTYACTFNTAIEFLKEKIDLENEYQATSITIYPKSQFPLINEIKA